MTLCAVLACGPNEKEKTLIAKLANSLQTQCIGRFSIDLPKTFKPSTPEVTLYYGLGQDFTTADVLIIDPHSSSEKFSARVDKRANDIAAETNSKTQGNL